MIGIKDKKQAATANANANENGHENGNDDDSIDVADDEKCDQLATYSYKFNAEHHLHHFDSILKVYSQNIKVKDHLSCILPLSSQTMPGVVGDMGHYAVVHLSIHLWY